MATIEEEAVFDGSLRSPAARECWERSLAEEMQRGERYESRAVCSV